MGVNTRKTSEAVGNEKERRQKKKKPIKYIFSEILCLLLSQNCPIKK